MHLIPWSAAYPGFASFSRPTSSLAAAGEVAPKASLFSFIPSRPRRKDATKQAERDELASGATHKIGGVLYEIGGKHGIQPSAKAARGGRNVGGTQLSPIQLDCLRAARRRDEDEPDWGAYWTRLAEHQEAAGQHLAASMAPRRGAENETVPWHHDQAAHAAASGWP